MFVVFLPSQKIDESENFYENIMGFYDDVHGYRLNIKGYENICIRPQIGGDKYPAGHCYFRYEIESNFLTYCKNLMDKGVEFRIIAMTPGGYGGIVIDPDGNEFIVECPEFEDDDSSINPNNWECYRRY
ncbi:hypothetical protein BTA51_11200 [Hahella sp. CCB-MM4]|uniref:VOC family protein n=1 Tax=Hahella sp. (strain CCB-MM4) TaxID=1926491 RepID=UPI000B9C0ED3|nr:VOC family protein [Hahella sp. CCB-MM4]OZG73562.1 hypothetical protein BTA51_11200 [Hahella sp. CCB-MM4]